MKRLSLSFCILLLLGTVGLGQDKPPAPKAGDSPLKTLKERSSYAIGLNIGNSIKRDGLEVDLKILAQGLADAIGGKKPLLTDAQIQETMLALQKELRERQQKKASEAAAKNKADGEAFLASNKKKKGVVTLESGLQYEVIKAGNGPTPKKTDTVSAHYHGTLIDGTVFDSSVQRKMPLEIPVTGVIKGWTEALLKMKVGDKWRLFIPSELAYGERGAGRAIGPNSVLIFEIELLSIK